MIHNRNSRKIIELTEQLRRNYDAVRKLMDRYETTRTSTFYNIHGNQRGRQLELAWIHKITDRVLQKREWLLGELGMAIMSEQRRTVTINKRREARSDQNRPEMIEVTDPEIMTTR